MHRLALGLALFASLSTLAVAAPSAAQARPNEARARALRESGRELARTGRFDEALPVFREASALTADATVWLEVAEMADRLRIDAVALEAYERYLALRPDATDRAEIEARALVLRELREGRRWVLAEGRLVRAVRAPGTRQETLVDWEGQPVVVQPSRVAALAQWDGTMGDAPPPRVTPELAPFPEMPLGLGRRLSQP